MTETDVSDVYVRLGNDFNAAVAAFGQFGIEMTYVFAWLTGKSFRKILKTISEASSCPFRITCVLNSNNAFLKTPHPAILRYICPEYAKS